MIKYLSIILIIWAELTAGAQVLPAPEGLLVDLLREPSAAVITGRTPEFSWIFPQSGGKQEAYRILVASSPFLLAEGKADFWDSEPVRGYQSIGVPFRGKELKANSIYWWAVKVVSESGLESPYSEPQQFCTGNFDRSDLDYPAQSRWIELSSNNWVSEDKQRASLEYLDPVDIEKRENGVYFIAFEKSVIGTLTFVAAAEENCRITLFMGERKNEDQGVHKEPGRTNIGFKEITLDLKKGSHYYVVELESKNPKGYLHSQKLAPHYPEVMPFRYVEIVGKAGAYEIKEAKQAALFYFFDDAASAFTCSNENLVKVWDLCKYTQKSTPFLGVYADGNRERMPYEADAYIQMLSHFATDREYSIARYTIGFLLDHASWPTEWQMHMVLMAWDYYMQTGDVDLLKDRYEDLKRKSLIALADDNGLISTRTGRKSEEFLRSLNFPGKAEQFRDIVDWPQAGGFGGVMGETDGYVFTDYNTVVNAFHNRCLVLMARIARLTGHSDEVAFFEERARDHRQAFNATFFNGEKGIYRDGEATDHSSLHANMFPMAFQLVPEEDMDSVSAFIKSRGMACSVYGSQYLLEALYNGGEEDHALALMSSESKRSWLNMLRVGSTMTTEAWDEVFKPNLTWNHAWGSAPANIIARKTMGIEPLEPTFSLFRISPQPGSLGTASIKVPTIRGPVQSKIIVEGNSWEMTVSVPGNAKAELWLPATFNRVEVNHNRVEPIRSENFAGDVRRVFPIGSGNFHVRALAN